MLIYPDFLNTQTNFIKVSDISNTYLKYIHVNTLNSELYTFSSDGILFAYWRVYQSVRPLKHSKLIKELCLIDRSILVHIFP